MGSAISTVNGYPESKGTIKSEVPWNNAVGTLSSASIQSKSPIPPQQLISAVGLLLWLKSLPSQSIHPKSGSFPPP